VTLITIIKIINIKSYCIFNVMAKYQIEGDINFYDELYKSLDDQEEDSSGRCLITNKPLEEDCVVLDCNHKFNYDAIYNDIFNHKKKYNSMEKNSIKANELRCPYCRTIQKHLLPLKDGYKKVHGVNYFDENQAFMTTTYEYKTNYIVGNCNYKLNTHNTNNIIHISNEIIENECPNKYVKLLPADGKHYCIKHYSVAFYNIIKANKQKEKEEKKAAILLQKIKAKEENMKAKEEKMKAKEEEKKAKEEEKIKKLAEKMQCKNVIVSSSQEQSGCNQVLKTGKNKGLSCGAKICNEGLCSRHFKMQTLVVPDPIPVVEIQEQNT